MSTPSVRHPGQQTQATPFYQAPGHPIAYFPSLAPHVGGTNAAILLCQLLYWTPRAKDPEGWIYKTQLELIYETGLSRHEQRAARTALKARGLLEERYDRLDHQLYVRVQVATYNAMILAMHEASADADPPKPWKINQIRKSDMAMYMNRISGHTEIGHGDIRHSDIASTETPEITTEKDGRTREKIEARPPCMCYGHRKHYCQHHQATYLPPGT
jgi:hypothetical protein